MRLYWKDRPGLSITLVGLAIFLGATACEFYLQRPSREPESRWEANQLIPRDPRSPTVDRRDFHTKPSPVPSLLTHSFLLLCLGLGGTLTMAGLRDMTRPDRGVA
jgi:hypothetical protein